MEWNRTEVAALVNPSCSRCRGTGLIAEDPCACVLRRIFKECYSRFRSCVRRSGASVVKLERIGLGTGRSTHMTFSLKSEEFMADFCLIARRALRTDEYRLFKYHYLLGAYVRLLQRRFKNASTPVVERALRTIEEKLGRVFRETRPFALFPLDEYFSSPQRGVVTASTRPDVLSHRTPLRIPLAPKAAA